MDGPVQFAMRLLVAVAASSAWGATADTSEPAAVESGVQPARPRAVSPRTAARLAAAASRLDSPPPTDLAARPGSAGALPLPQSAAVVRLPSYIVRQAPLPRPHEVMTGAERARVAMEQYLGAEDGLERALNMISFAGLWEKLPVLGRYPFIVGQYSGRNAGPPIGPRTNEQRALELDEKARLAERMKQLSGLSSTRVQPAK